MPMTEQEAAITIEICRKHVPIHTLAKMTAELEQKICPVTSNDSVRDTLRALAAGARDALVKDAMATFEHTDAEPWYKTLAKKWGLIK